MKFTLEWLKEFLDTSASVGEISDKLNQIGLEVDDITDKASELKDFNCVLVQEVKKHPESEHLNVCTVLKSDGCVLQIVCGAPNVKSGIKSILCPVGSTVPGLGVKITKSKIRGVESCGMLCSEKELGLGDDENGIIVLPDDVPLGKNIADIKGLDDIIFDIAITPNRGDCLGVYGIARDLAATGIGVLKPIDKPFVKETENSPLKVEIETEYCGEFAVRYIKNVKNCESPFWIKKRLIAVGFTPKNALVDITNYIMWEFNRPLHCYDYKKTGNDFLIRGATDGEKYIALNGKEYVLPKDATLICANDKILGAGGIIGGVDSMTEMDTKEIVVECAFFDPMNIAATARKIGVNTDAKYRFERCVDYADTDFILDYAAKLIMEICGGEIANSIRDTKKTREQKNIKFLHSDILRILGMDISADEIKAILKQLGYVLTLNEDEYEVIVPSWRPYIEIKENVIEDIIRIYGYDRLISIPINDEEIDEDGVNKINRERSNKFYEINKLLASNGLTEVISWSFIKEKMASEFAVLNDDLKLLNPISQDMTYMRPSLLPGMIDIIKYNNARSINNVAIFENGIVFDGSKTNEQKKVLAGLRSGLAMEKNIYGTSRQYDIYDVKKDLFDVLLLYGINAENLILKKEVPNYYNSARSGSVVMGNTVIGVFGEIHPSIIAKFEIKNSVNAFELYLDSIPRNKDKTTQKKRIVLNNLLPIYRDFAFIIDKNLEIGGIIDIVKKINKDLIKEINLFDIYSGKGIEENKKSVAFSIKIQPIDKNLTIEEIDAICDKVISEITQKVGGILRDK